MSKKKKKGLIPNLAINITPPITKYKIGGMHHNVGAVLDQKPIFAFDYISLNKKDFCFNSARIDSKDYGRIFEALKSISDKSYRELTESRIFHFHDVDFSDVSLTESNFRKCLNSSSRNNNDLPTIYQFKAFEEARIFGFFCHKVFYPVFFDRNHNAYKRK